MLQAMEARFDDHCMVVKNDPRRDIDTIITLSFAPAGFSGVPDT